MAYLHFDKTKLINLEYSLKREVIRTNRSGTFACSTIIDCNTRKYHGLLICPLPKIDDERHILLSGLDETIIQHDQEFNLGLHKYAGNHYEPKGHKYIRNFSGSPYPKLEYQVGDVVLTKEKIMIENESQILIKYTLIEAKSSTRIKFKPFLSFRNIHSLSKSNLNINTKYTEVSNGISSKLYNNYPNLFMQFNKQPEFTPAPDWYYNIEYSEDHKRGYDYKEDLYVPGFFEMKMKKGESIIFSASLKENKPKTLNRLFKSEINKRIAHDNFNSCLANTVQQFFISNNNKLDIIAGYPWLPIRSRDALISLPGLTLPFNNKHNYTEVLNTISQKFDNHLIKEIPTDLNSGYPLDIPLWYIWSVQQFSLRYGNNTVWEQFGNTISTIITGYLHEQKLFEVQLNGLLYSKNETSPTSWMNAVADNKTIVKRDGFIVEANALWYNALCYILEFKDEIQNKKLLQTVNSLKQKVEQSFSQIFWNESVGYLNDFVSNKETNSQLRPNQLFAASLPYSVLKKQQIKSILDKIKSELLTPFGIKSLTPTDKNYMATYKGSHYMREKAAFNGSVWPWLLTSYFEALLKIEPNSAIIKGEQYLSNFENELQIDGICSISELYNGNPPQKAKGAISFALNTGELIRLKKFIDSEK